MRVVKTRGMTGAYPVYNNMPTVNLPSAEVLGFRTGLEQDRPFYYSDDTQYWESQRPAELQRARESYMSGFPAGVEDPATDPRMNNAIEPVYPMNWVSPSGDVEAIASSLGMLAEGDYLGAGIGGGLALAGVFLPGSFQVKSTMADGVLERSLDSKGMIHPNAVRAIIDSKNTGETEKYLLSSALENVAVDPATGRVNYNELKQKVDELVPRMRAEESGEYADYGYDNVFEENYLLPGVEKPKSEMVGLFPEQEGIYPVHGAHLDEPGYGHYRSAVLPQDPETAYITEIQSDAATSDLAKSSVLDHPEMDNTGRHIDVMNNTYDLNTIKGNNYDFDYDQMMETILKSEDPEKALKEYPMVKPEAIRARINLNQGQIDNIQDDKVEDFLNGVLSDLEGAVSSFFSNKEKMSFQDVYDLDRMIDNKLGDIAPYKFEILDELETFLGQQFDEIATNLYPPGTDLRGSRARYIQDVLSGNHMGSFKGNPEIKELFDSWKDIREAQLFLKNMRRTLIGVPYGASQSSQRFFMALQNDLYGGLNYDLFQEFANYTPNPITKSSVKNYTERILQEAVDDVVSKNPQAKRIRIPVGKTAAKIQGHDSVKGSTVKYDKMDKTIKRVLGVKPNKVAGPGGFEYWEFDLPEGGFEKQVFKFGGKIKAIKKRKGKFGIIKQ